MAETDVVRRGTDADDLALAVDDGGRLWAAASWASLAAEGVWLAEIGASGLGAPVAVGANGDHRPHFRPAVCGLRDGAVAVACGLDGVVRGVMVDGAGAVRRWSLAVDGVPWHAALAREPGADCVWLALELRRPGERLVHLAVLDAGSGRSAPALVLGATDRWCRWPTVAAAPGGGVAVAWCEGPARGVAEIRCARIDRDGQIAVALAVGPGDAPAIAVAADGRVALAWHTGGASQVDASRADASVIRALAAAWWQPATGALERLVPPVGAADDDALRGEDQGWELPAIAVDLEGRLWLAGRSSHGHHLAVADRGGVWSARQPLCQPGWGGRGRRLALCARDDRVWLARRAPDGIEVRALPLPPPAPRLPTAPPAAWSTPDEQGPSAVAPAPSRPRRAGPAAVLFGDLHQHTAHSDGCGSLEDLWIAARDRRGLDFAAVTDHDRFCRRSLGPGTWQYTCSVADDFHEPGHFVALAAYEFTGARHPGPGHKCVYFGDRVPDRIPDKDVTAIFDVLRAFGGIAVPHHVGWTGGDFAHHDEELQPVWELCSVHGCYEAVDGGCGARPPRADCILPGQFVRDALAAGLRFGFIGSTDSHGLDWHHGVFGRRNPFSSGLAGVVGAEPTRDGILAAIRARRTYATSGARIGVRVELDGAPMGSVVPAHTAGELRIEIDGTAAIRRLALVSSRGERTIHEGGGARCGVTLDLAAPAVAGDYVYVRVEQVDGELAWASPIWFGDSAHHHQPG
jgi:hypothetical protein